MRIAGIALIIITISSIATICAGEDREQGDGLFSNGSFLSDTISSATDKLSRVGSGEERIVDDGARGAPDGIMEYDGDPFRRAGTGFTKEEYRRNREMSEEKKKSRAE